MMLRVNCLSSTILIIVILGMLTLEIVTAPIEEQMRRIHKRKKKPCPRESPRWFFAHDITILFGDLTVVNSIPCGATAMPLIHRPGNNNNNHLTGHKPGSGLLGHHQHEGGLFGQHHHHHGGLLGSHHQGGGGLLGSHHQGGGGLFGHHQNGGIFGHNPQPGPKPVYETVNEDGNSSTERYKPGMIVGAVGSQVSGYPQDLSHLTLLDQINEHLGKIVKPFVDLFSR